ncbi:MAG: hypothetical protein ACREBR_04605 [bacterium]
MLKKLKKILANFLLDLDLHLLVWAARLDPIEEKQKDQEPYYGPYTFSNFKEGMGRTDYCTRHDAASKLVGYYLYSNGHPLLEELVRAAEVLLEDTSATARDISFLVGAWKDQVSAATDQEREAAEERESAIYERVAIKDQNKGDK